MIVIGTADVPTPTQQVNVFKQPAGCRFVAVANGCTNQPVNFTDWYRVPTRSIFINGPYQTALTTAGRFHLFCHARHIHRTVYMERLTAVMMPRIPLPSVLPVVTVTPSLSICLGNSVQLNASGATQFDWAPSQGLSCITCANPVATPVITTPYVVTGTNSFGCTSQATVVVTVIQPLNMTTSGNDTLCIGQSVNLQASGAASYIWTPAQGLNNPRISNPTASPVVTTTTGVDMTDSAALPILHLSLLLLASIQRLT
jgi:hypothetical protein